MKTEWESQASCAQSAGLIDDVEASSRRALLAGLGLAAVGMAGTAMAQTTAKPLPGSSVASAWGRVNNRLLRRITYGITEKEARRCDRMGFQAYLDEQINFAKIDDSACDRVIAASYPRSQWDASRMRGQDWGDMHNDLFGHLYHRAVYSRRQLRERMVEFWLDHFNVSTVKIGYEQMLPYVRTLRLYSMGRFRTLLGAVCKSPAMLAYLDNDPNDPVFPNINFARELCELHTLGANNGYTGKDLPQVARIMTGWTWQWDSTQPEYNKFRFVPSMHSGGTKVVMGKIFAFSGQSEGENLLDFLASHPNTASHMAFKLCRFFLGYNPPPATVAAVARAWMDSGGDIATVLRHVLTRANLAAAGPKFKRPFYWVASSLRAVPAVTPITYWGAVHQTISVAGMEPYSWVTPDGFPDRYDYWGPNILAPVNWSLGYPTGAVWDPLPDPATQFRADGTAKGVVGAINRQLFGGEGQPSDVEALLRFAGSGPIEGNKVATLTALAMASPSFAWH